MKFSVSIRKIHEYMQNTYRIHDQNTYFETSKQNMCHLNTVFVVLVLNIDFWSVLILSDGFEGQPRGFWWFSVVVFDCARVHC